jgi:hypothetical protein
MLRRALEPLGDTRDDLSGDGDATKLRLAFCPEHERAQSAAKFGLLGQLSSEPCVFEFFHHAPEMSQLLDCHRRHLNLDHDRATQSKPSATGPQQSIRRPALVSTLWVISVHRPLAAVRGLGLLHIQDQPEGVYTAAPGLRFRLVVLDEMAAGVRSTLLFRLMGQGEPLSLAIEEALTLPEKRWERAVALEMLREVRTELLQRTAAPAAGVEALEALEESFLISTRVLGD